MGSLSVLPLPPMERVSIQTDVLVVGRDQHRHVFRPVEEVARADVVPHLVPRRLAMRHRDHEPAPGAEQPKGRMVVQAVVGFDGEADDHPGRVVPAHQRVLRRAGKGQHLPAGGHEHGHTRMHHHTSTWVTTGAARAASGGHGVTQTGITPSLGSAMAAKAPRLRSRIVLPPKPPRSVIVTVILAPFSRLVTVTTLPHGRVLLAAVAPHWWKMSP